MMTVAFTPRGIHEEHNMTTSPVPTGTSTTIGLAQILESAIILSWKELMRERTSSVHVEYRLGPGGSLEYLKVWSLITRGDPYLVCVDAYSIVCRQSCEFQQ
jgi:hypothetical protein